MSTPAPSKVLPAIETEVVVIGGGPAGSTASTLIAQQGRQVSALEVDVQLLLGSGSESKVPAQITVETPSPIADVGTCER